MRTVAILFLLGAYSVRAATLYCSPSGGGSGADFNNLATFPTSGGTRGNTYKLVDGSYGSITLGTAASGTTTITIEKVTSADSGVAGYSSTLHDGQATFSSITCNDPYYIVDGKVRNEANWFSGSPYGFRVTEINADSGNGDNADNTIFRYCDIGDTYSETYINGMNVTGVRMVYVQNDVTFHRCWIHNYNGAGMQLAGAHHFIIEYCAFGPGWGKEAIRGGNQNPGHHHIIRYNQFRNSTQTNPEDGTSGITAEIGIWDSETEGTLDGNEIYGNVFTNAFSGGRNSVIAVGNFNGGGFGGVQANNTLVYNNTLVGIRESSVYSMIHIAAGSGNEAKNNLFHHCIDSDSTANSVANNYSVSTNPFTAAMSYDYSLVGPVPTGTSLSSPYNLDPAGITRGADGTFEVGAYEFDSGAEGDTTDPEVTAFTIPSTATSLTVSISTFTATDDTAVTGYLVNESASTPSGGDAGWSGSAQTQYVFGSAGSKTLYAWAKDAAGNISTSLSDSVVITLPDSSISITTFGAGNHYKK